MYRRFARILVVSVFLISTLLAGLNHGVAIGQQGDFHAAIKVIAQSGNIGYYSLAEPPGYPGAHCFYQPTGDGIVNVDRQSADPMTVTSRTSHPQQPVDVITKLYQQLATGSLDLLWSSASLRVTPTTHPEFVNPTSPPTEPAGPTYVLAYLIKWLNPNNLNAVEGQVEIAYTHYLPTSFPPLQTLPDAPVCASIWPPFVETSVSTGIVGSTLDYSVHRYPIKVTVNARWDGIVVDTVHTSKSAKAIGALTIPAAPMGPHTIKWNYGSWVASKMYTIKPRIKVIPSSDVSRGQTVDISLRGFAAHETVRIRWKKGTSYANIATVMTSSTGSANKDVHVPTFVPDGPTSVRGDGTHGHAQTNAVTVSGGPMSGSTVKAPTPTPTATTTASATETTTASPTVAPTDTPEASPSVEPTTPTATPEETASPTDTQVVEEPSPEPSETASPTTTPTDVATVTPEPTAAQGAHRVHSAPRTSRQIEVSP